MTWQGRAWLGTGVLVYVGNVGPTDDHVHAACQVMRILDDGNVLVELDGELIGPTPFVVIPSGARHRLVPTDLDTVALSVYLEVGTAAASSVHRQLSGTCGNPPAAPLQLVESWPIAGSASNDHCASVTAMISSLQKSDDGPALVHEYVRRALEVVAESISGRVTLTDVSDQVGVSPSHLSRLWRSELGLSFNRWVRWERLREAARAISHGASITDAAHAAGFSDGAHLSRVCRDMFGLSPLALTTGVTVV